MSIEDSDALFGQLEISSQAYFWSNRWQAGEREAQEDIDNGRMVRSDNIDEALDFLDNGEEILR